MRARDLSFALLFLCTAACEKCAPGQVGQGLARLTVRNVGAITTAINDDTACGFESEAAKNSWVASGPSGEIGEVVWRVENCEVKFDSDSPAEKTNCNGVLSTTSGTIKVTATRTIQGYITGDRINPVIPAGPTAVSIHLENAEFENFKVTAADSDAVLTMVSGAISAVVKPRVAADADRGVCSVSTGDATMAEIKYSPSKVHITTEDRDFDVDVNSSNLSAVNGLFDDQENLLWGEITVWDSQQNIPTDDDEQQLNPDYDREKQIAGFSCLEEIAEPVRYDCETDVRPLIAQGAAQLSIQTLGALAKIAESDTTCGFSSPAVKNSPSITGLLGEPGGAAVFTIAAPCTHDFPPNTVIETDCNGKKTYASGTVRFSGTKRVEGYVSGDAVDPIVPVKRDPALLTISADFSNFSAWSDPGKNKLTISAGGLSGTIMPRLARDLDTGACSIDTPVATIDGVTWSNGQVEIHSDGMTFGVTLNSSSLTAQNGKKENVENYLAGQLVMDGTSFEIPISDNPVLDPDYDPNVFTSSYTCDAMISVPASDADCDMQQTLAEGAGRLVIQTVGALGTMINVNRRCGFESRLVLLRPDRVEGEVGQQGLMEWSVEGCEFDENDPTEYDADCKNRTKNYQGRVEVDAARIVRGLREEISIFDLINIDSIVPGSPDAVDLTLSKVTLENFIAFDLNPNAETPERALFVESGELSAQVHPILGESLETAGRFDAPTYIARMTNVRLTNAPAIIYFEGKQFKVRIDRAELEAFNGSYSGAGMSNLIQGSVTLNGRTFNFPASSGLDPDFNQTDFTERYSCRVTQPLPPAP
jgi:hypothetical protein